MASISSFPADGSAAGVAAERGWDVVAIERKGRGVVSTAEIAAGSAVLTEARPLVSVVHAARSLQACATCMGLRLSEVSTKFLPQPLMCNGCQQVCWCSEECRNQSQVAQAHPAQLCFAYRRLAEMVATAKAKSGSGAAVVSPASGSDAAAREAALLDDESLSDARLVFAGYYFRRYRADEFARWTELCSPPEPTAAAPRASSSAASAASASASVAAAPASSSSSAGSAALSAAAAENEARIEAIHDIVVECLQYAADAIAQPTPVSGSPQEVAAASPPQATVPAAAAQPELAASLAVEPAAAASAAVSPSLLPPPPLSLPKFQKQFTDLHISHPSDDVTSSLAADVDLAVTRRMLLKAQCNAMALSAPHDKLGNRQTPRGYAIYTAAAMFNHSCMPNVARFDHIDARDIKFQRKGASDTVAPKPAQAAAAASSGGAAAASSGAAASSSPFSDDSASLLAPSPSDCASSSAFTPLLLELRALQAIPPYTELTLSYVPLFWERRARQDQLADEFGFRCRCLRCRAEKAQEREERLLRQAGEHDEDEEEHSHSHDHGEEDEDEDGEDDEEGEDDDEDEEEPLSDDSDDESSSDPLPSRGECNIFLSKYICPSKTCGGTLAPVKEGSLAASKAPPVIQGAAGRALGGHMECNTCGKLRTDAQFQRQLQKEFGAKK